MNLSMSKLTLTERITSEEVQRILKGTNWRNYEARIGWSMQIPRCHFYDGAWAESQKEICFYWQYWLTDGRALYPAGEEGLEDYLKNLREVVPEGHLKTNHERAEKFLRTEK